MASLVNRLSARQVANETKEGMYPDGNGLYLQVGKTGTKSWALRYQIAGRPRQMGLGSCGTFTLAEARERARQARQSIADGVDPIDKRASERSALKAANQKALTFKQAAVKYIEAHTASWKGARHEKQWTQSLTDYAFPVIGSLNVAHVETAHVVKILEPIWIEKTDTASKLRGRIESVLGWAAARGLRSETNPARWKNHLSTILPKPSKVKTVEHHPALAIDEMPAFIVKLRALDSISARALEMTVLTACRTGSVNGMTDAELDLDAAVWTIPASRMKSGKEHRVPLCDRAVEIIKAMPRIAGNPFVFVGSRYGKGLSDMAQLECLRNIAPDVVTHGFRSTFRDWAGDRTNFSREVIEQALAHKLKDAAEAAYRRSDALEKRRRLMDAWAGFIGTTPAAKGSNVTPIRAA